MTNSDTDRDNGQRPRASMNVAIRRAADQFGALVGRDPYAITGVRTGENGGWSVLIDVLELERVPRTASVMATYRVDLDSKGELEAYERLRRFTMGAVDPS